MYLEKGFKIQIFDLWDCQHVFFCRDKNAEELEAYYNKKFAETSDRLVSDIIFIILVKCSGNPINNNNNKQNKALLYPEMFK